MARAYIEYLPPKPKQRVEKFCKPSLDNRISHKTGTAAVCQQCYRKFVLAYYTGEGGFGGWAWQPVRWYSWYRRIKFNRAVNASR